MIDPKLQSAADELRGEGDDYQQMLALFSQISQRIKAINADPLAFQTTSGQHDPKMLTAFNSLMSTAAKIISSLHSMRNNDRFLSTVLEDHTKKFASMVAPALLDELTEIDAALESIVTWLDASGDQPDDGVHRECDCGKCRRKPDLSAVADRVVTLRGKIGAFRAQRFLRIFMDAATNTARATASQLGLH